MDGTGEQFLPGAAFPEEEHRCRSGCCLQCHLLGSLKLWIAPQDVFDRFLRLSFSEFVGYVTDVIEVLQKCHGPCDSPAAEKGSGGGDVV